MEIIAPVLMVIAIALVYFTPALIAKQRRAENLMAIEFINLVVGWTIIGWFGSFVWACTSPAKPQAAISTSAPLEELREKRKKLVSQFAFGEFNKSAHAAALRDMDEKIQCEEEKLKARKENPANAESAVASLEKLAKMKADGLISEEEFALGKKKILAA